MGAPTWNTPDDIAKHRAMTPKERLAKSLRITRGAGSRPVGDAPVWWHRRALARFRRSF